MLFVSILLGAVGQLLLKIGASQLAPFALSLPNLPGTLMRAFTNPWVLTGTAMYAGSMVTWLKVLSTMELSIAYPMVSLGYVVVMLLSFFFLGEPFTLSKILGVAAVMTGVILIGQH